MTSYSIKDYFLEIAIITMKTESRKNPRYKIFADLRIKVKKKTIIGVAYNVSKGGLNFVADETIKDNDICSISMMMQTQVSYQLDGKIVYASFIDNSSSIGKYGLEFSNNISSNELKYIIDLFKLI